MCARALYIGLTCQMGHLVSVTQDAIFCEFVLRLVFVFYLFHLWVPTNQDSPKLVEFIRIKAYN